MKYVTVTSVLLTASIVMAVLNFLTGNILGAGLLFLSSGVLAYGSVKLNRAKKLDAVNKKMLL